MADDAAKPSDNLTEDAREAGEMGEKPDLGVKRDALIEALEGSNLGSDTRAGSLRGGSATGSDNDPDQKAVDARLAEIGKATAEARTPPSTEPSDVKNTGVAPGEPADAGKSGPATG
jgi:hypothetical protein